MTKIEKEEAKTENESYKMKDSIQKGSKNYLVKRVESRHGNYVFSL